jgi:hypothetical protein
VIELQANDVAAKLRIYADKSEDRNTEFALSRLAGEIELIQTFRSAGRYTEAKYTTAAFRRHLSEFEEVAAAILPDALLESLWQYAGEIDALPNTVNVADRSGELLKRGSAPAGPELFPVGARVRIAPLAALERFESSWKLHHPLLEEQFKYAGSLARVKAVGYHHGGDVLYSLDTTGDFLWHEQCLERA